MKKAVPFTSKLTLDKFQVANFANLQVIKGGREFTIKDKTEEDEQQK